MKSRTLNYANRHTPTPATPNRQNVTTPRYEEAKTGLAVETPGDAGQRWSKAVQAHEEGLKLIAQATEERHAVIAELQAGGGFTQDDIAAMLGITQQRVTQYLQGKTKS